MLKGVKDERGRTYGNRTSLSLYGVEWGEGASEAGEAGPIASMTIRVGAVRASRDDGKHGEAGWRRMEAVVLFVEGS